MIGDSENVKVDERVVLSKFEGDPVPENEFERVHILNGKVVSIEQIQDGKVVATQAVEEV